MSEQHKNYLFDLGYLLRENAEKARDEYKAAKGTDDEAFQCGRSMAYYEVMSLLVSQALAFEMAIENLHLHGFDPDRDLLK